MIIQVKHQETVTVNVTEIKLPYYFITNHSEYSRQCLAVMEDLTMVNVYMGDTYQSISMQAGTIEQIEHMLDVAFSKHENRKEITEAEFRLLLEEFNQKTLPTQTTPTK